MGAVVVVIKFAFVIAVVNSCCTSRQYEILLSFVYTELCGL